MNWFTKGLTSKKVGFGQDGNAYEGGNCEHLKEGDAAHGQSSENDSFGSEVYLMCKPCYEQFLEEQRVLPTTCRDCQQEFPKNEMKLYIPYILDGSPSENEEAKKWICAGCQEGDRHKNRVAYDQELRDRDRDEEEDNWDGDDGPDDDDFPEED